MNAAVRAWLLEKAKDELAEALSDQKQSAALLEEMRRREAGKDGWNASAWKGESRKAARGLAYDKRRVAQLRKVATWLRTGR